MVLNPAANKSRAAAKQEVISRFLGEHRIKPFWHITTRPGEATCIVKGIPEEALTVAVGGDGTVHEVAAACIGTSRVMGVLPVGSGNDFTKPLGIGPRLRQAMEILVRGKVRVVDAGEVNGVLFINGLGIGFDAEVAANVVKAPRYLGGFGGYMWAVYKLLADLECLTARLSLDGEVVESKTILVAAALGTTYGAMFKLAPGAKVDDGLFDVVWSDELSRVEVLKLIPAVLRGSHIKHPKIHSARATEISVELTRATPAHVDGELMTPTRGFQARVLPGSLRVIAP